MYIPSLVKSIDIYSSYRLETKIRTDGRTTGGRTDDQRDTIILRLMTKCVLYITTRTRTIGIARSSTKRMPRMLTIAQCRGKVFAILHSESENFVLM